MRNAATKTRRTLVDRITRRGVDDSAARLVIPDERQRQMEDGFLRARGGQYLRLGIQRYVESALSPTRNRLAKTPLPDDRRVLRNGVQRLDERLADERRRRLDRIAYPEVEDGDAAARQV